MKRLKSRGGNACLSGRSGKALGVFAVDLGTNFFRQPKGIERRHQLAAVEITTEEQAVGEFEDKFARMLQVSLQGRERGIR